MKARDLLAEASRHLRLHNEEYSHRTSDDLIAQIGAAAKQEPVAYRFKMKSLASGRWHLIDRCDPAYPEIEASGLFEIEALIVSHEVSKKIPAR